MKFNEKLILLRKQHGYSQETFAEKLGVSRQAVSRWETGDSTPEMSLFAKICAIYSISADYLINDDIDEESAVPIIKAKTEEVIKAKRDNKIFRLVAAISFSVSGFCALIGIIEATSDLQQAVSCFWAFAAVAYAVFNFVRYFQAE